MGVVITTAIMLRESLFYEIFYVASLLLLVAIFRELFGKSRDDSLVFALNITMIFAPHRL